MNTFEQKEPGMEQNVSNEKTAAQEQSTNGCGCGCGGGKGSNKIVVAIWVVLLLGFACVLAYTRSNGQNKADKLLQSAYTLYEQQNFVEAADHLRQAAELGNPWAQIYYGGCLKQGSGVAADPAAAVEWYRKAAAQNIPVAYYELAVCYEYGQGVTPNLDEAIAWYQKALDGGIGEAQAALDRIEKLKAEATPEAKALALYQQAMEFFDRQDKDVECADLLRQSAELGFVWAQLFYGRFLCKGIGTALDPVEAVEWFRKAADQNCHEAFYELGVCYENGEGVERDFDQAIAWYRKAVDGGFDRAQSAIIRVEKAKALKEAEK